ncbi:MAG: TIGR01777 family oxidoreductase [Planctomycetaceae bacterium]
MKLEEFVHRSHLPASAAEAFRWHANPGAFERLSPPWQQVRILDRHGGIEPGGRVELRVKIGPFWRRWVAEHRECEPDASYRDVQVKGPFGHWDHTHLFLPEAGGDSFLEDRVAYAPPFGWAGRLLLSRLCKRELQRLFRYRHAVTAADLATHRFHREAQRKRVLVTGSSGLAGSTLVHFLRAGGHGVLRLTHEPRKGFRAWQPMAGRLDPGVLEGFDAIVHLAAESEYEGAWTPAKRARLVASRAGATRLLCETIARLSSPPRVLVSASSTAIYGSRGDTPLRGDEPAGDDFLARAYRDKEEAAAPAVGGGVRVVHLRFGRILSPAGGLLRSALVQFRRGLGGWTGSGRRYVSWIALDDAVGAIHHALLTPELAGAINAVAPHPLSAREFGRALARVLSRPCWLRRPAFGERRLLYASQRAVPDRLIASGYRFRHPLLEPALRACLGREP